MEDYEDTAEEVIQSDMRTAYQESFNEYHDE